MRRRRKSPCSTLLNKAHTQREKEEKKAKREKRHTQRRAY